MTQDITLEQKALAVPERAKGLYVSDNDSYEKAGELLKTIKSLRAEIKDTFDPIIKKAHAAHKEAVGQKKRHDLPLDSAESIIKSRLLSYAQEQERKRVEAERKAQEEAQIQEAVDEEAQGDTQASEDALNGQGHVAVSVASQTPTVPGISYTDHWSAEVTDLKALALAVGEGKAPITLILANMPVLNAQARALKAEMNYPGVKAVKSQTVNARTS